MKTFMIKGAAWCIRRGKAKAQEHMNMNDD